MCVLIFERMCYAEVEDAIKVCVHMRVGVCTCVCVCVCVCVCACVFVCTHM